MAWGIECLGFSYSTGNKKHWCSQLTWLDSAHQLPVTQDNTPTLLTHNRRVVTIWKSIEMTVNRLSVTLLYNQNSSTKISSFQSYRTSLRYLQLVSWTPFERQVCVRGTYAENWKNNAYPKGHQKRLSCNPFLSCVVRVSFFLWDRVRVSTYTLSGMQLTV